MDGQGQRRAPVAEGGPDEHEVTVHYTAQAPGKLLPHAKERIGWACPSVIIRIITVEAKLLVAIH